MGKFTWNPWLDIDELGEVADRLVERKRTERCHGRECVRAWQPSADVVETSEAFVISMELPGIPKDGAVIELDGGELRVHGERPIDRRGEGIFHLLERSYGPFQRTFLLPEGVDSTGIQALFSDGLLTVTVPKSRKREGSRRITINTSD